MGEKLDAFVAHLDLTRVLRSKKEEVEQALRSLGFMPTQASDDTHPDRGASN
jgi:hypothetical protein